MLLKDQIEWYLQHIQTRNRGRVKPATLKLYQCFARVHVLPMLGDVDLESFTNGPMKGFTAKLVAKSLSPKTVKEITSFLRSAIAAAVDAEGNQLYPRTWNHKFVDAPPVKNQRQPFVTREALQAILRNKSFSVRDRVFVALIACSGLRLGEIQALRIGPETQGESTWDAENCIIHVKKSVWGGQFQEPKTSSSIRDINLFSGVNEMLKEFTTGRVQGELIFATRKGNPLPERYIRRYMLQPMQIEGAHVGRRFRATYLRGTSCPEDFIKVWLGHAKDSDITSRYSMLAADDGLRKHWAQKVGIGIELPSGHSAPARTPKKLVASKPNKVVDVRKSSMTVVHTLVRKRRKHESVLARADETLAAEANTNAFQATDADLPVLS